MQRIDWLIVGCYLAGMVVLALLLRCRSSQPDSFFLARRNMGWFPIGLSVMATAFSAVNYTAFAGEVATQGLYVMLVLPVFVLVAFPITRVVMPFYHRLGLTSAYEFLEWRYDRRVRRLASGLFILWRLSWMAVVLYVPSRVLSQMTGLPLPVWVVITGGVAVAYSATGGTRAVMWTDVVQVAVLVVGLIVGLVVVAGDAPGGLIGILQLGLRDGLARPFYPYDAAMFSLNPTVRITLASALIGGLVAFLGRYGADQMVVQRYFTAASLRDSQRGFHLNYASALMALVLLALFGFAIHAYAVSAGASLTANAKPMDLFTAFVLDLPFGVTGLIVVGLLAATMSSIDSGVTSCATAYMIDFHPQGTRLASCGRQCQDSGPCPGNARTMIWVRVATIAIALVAMGAACFVGRLGSIFEIANRIINGLGSPLLAIVLLGMFSRRTNAAGVFLGGLLGVGASVWLTATVDTLALHYYAVLNLLIVVILSYVASHLLWRIRPSRIPDRTAFWN